MAIDSSVRKSGTVELRLRLTVARQISELSG